MNVHAEPFCNGCACERLERQWDILLSQLSRAEDEEDTGLYLLSLHFHNTPDLRFFTSRERERVKAMLAFLMDDTARHRDLLSLLTLELREKRGRHARRAS